MSPDEAVREFAKNRQTFFSLVGGLSDKEFFEGEVPAPQFGKPTPRWRVGMLALEHHINHKAELFMYLKLIDVRVHTGHLYRG